MRAELIDYMGNDLTAVNAARTKTQQKMLEALDRGYTVTDEGVLYGPKGRINFKCYGKQKYPTFSTNWGSPLGIPVHQFAALVFYGRESFSTNLVVRHLDGNTMNLSKDNIKLGTHSENNMDKPAQTRRNAAGQARRSQGITPANAKLSAEDVNYIRRKYAELEGKKAPNGWTKKLSAELGVSRTVLIKVKRGEYYASISN